MQHISIHCMKLTKTEACPVLIFASFSLMWLKRDSNFIFSWSQQQQKTLPTSITGIDNDETLVTWQLFVYIVLKDTSNIHSHSTTHSLSISVAWFFLGEPGLASLIELRAMEVVVTTAAVRRAKLQSNRHRQQTNFLQAGSFLSPNQQCWSTEGKALHTPHLFH